MSLPKKAFIINNVFTCQTRVFADAAPGGLDYLADTEGEECNLKPAKEVFAVTAAMTSTEVRVSFEGLTRKHKHVHTKCGAHTACMKAVERLGRVVTVHFETTGPWS